jgi:hypothetical protein
VRARSERRAAKRSDDGKRRDECGALHVIVRRPSPYAGDR